jgi:hypothetical protein
MHDRRAGYFGRSAPRQVTSDQFAISSEKRATKRAFQKTWFFTVRDMTTVREF